MSMDVTRLPSGLTVVTDAMPHLQSASLGVWIGAGSRYEREDEQGGEGHDGGVNGGK